MEQDKTRIKSPETPPLSDVGRRKLLKVIVATSGAAAASLLLPDKWTKPIIDLGTVPAHAQMSGETITISSFSIFALPGGGEGFGRMGFGNGTLPFEANINYNDKDCDINNNTAVVLTSSHDGEIYPLPGTTLTNCKPVPGSFGPSACTGTLGVPFTHTAVNGTIIPTTLTIRIRNCNGHWSNILNKDFPPSMSLP